jgi:hypothetical protein
MRPGWDGRSVNALRLPLPVSQNERAPCIGGRLRLDPERGLNREPKPLSQFGICRAQERWRGEMIGALLPVKSMAKEGPFRGQTEKNSV